MCVKFAARESLGSTFSFSFIVDLIQRRWKETTQEEHIYLLYAANFFIYAYFHFHIKTIYLIFDNI